MEELTPWMDKNYIGLAFVDEENHFVLQFNDGTKNVYHIDDCNREQIKSILKDLKSQGIKVKEN
jgi:hypothetical protein